MASHKELEIAHRLALAQEKLEVAELLYENGKYADAVSRAYYAIYHAARAVLFLKNVDPHKHSGVVKMFGLHYVQPGIVEVKYSKALSYIKQLREKMDYEGTTKISPAECLHVLEDAREFVRKTKEIINCSE